MCLTLNEHATKKLATRKTPIKVFKTYIRADSQFLQNRYLPGFPIISKDGLIHSNRKTKQILKKERFIERWYADKKIFCKEHINIQKGIHVYLNKPEAYSGNIVIIEATADPKDLIGAEASAFDGKTPDTAVFMKIKVKPDVMKSFPRNVKAEKK